MATALPSRLGFGVSGALATPLVTARAAGALISAAFEGGVRVFDTAPAYGAGEAERRLGRALAALPRDEVFLSTKAGLFSFGLRGRRRDFSPDAIEASVRASLQRLGVDGVDALFLHGPAPGELTGALMTRLSELKAAGAFAALGVCGRGAEIEAAMEAGAGAIVMAPVHPFLNPAETARIERIRGSGATLLAIETAGDAPARFRAPRRPADLYPLAKRLAADGPGRGRVGVDAGLRFALECADAALFTTTRRAHLTANLAAAGEAGGGSGRRGPAR